LVKVIEHRGGDLHAQGLIGVSADDGGGRVGDLLAQGQLPGALGDDLGVETVETLALFERLAYARQRMKLQ
jgi:hypothetical protein